MQIINPYRFGSGTASLLTDLISWWSLDETSGTRADSHGSNDLTDNNTVTYNTGKHGNAAEFSAANNEYLSNTSATIPSGSWSAAGWFNYSSLPETSPRVISIGTGLGNASLFVWSTTNQPIYLTTNYGNAFTGITTSSTWYFFYIYFDSAGSELGVSLNNGTVATSASGVYTPSGNQLVLGRRVELTDGRDFNGLIDEVGLWDRVLTAAEVTALYNAGAGIGYPG